MSKLKQTLGMALQKIMDHFTGNGLMQEENTSAEAAAVSDEMSAAARQCAADCCVLLKNNGALPLEADAPVAVFGRCQLDWFYVGYGSGGDVKAPYYVNLMDGLRNAGVPVDEALAHIYSQWCNSEEHKADHGWWGHWPMNYPEMPLEQSLVEDAAKRCRTALVVIGRPAGEDRENTLTPGSYYLTEEEKQMLTAVTEAFQKTVVLLNAGNIIDMAWVEAYRIDALLLTWQGGMESGNGVADVLTGKVCPSGRLADTIARSYADYPSSSDFGGKAFNNYTEDIFVGYRYFTTFAPDKVLFPFGYGLSYTTFHKKVTDLSFKEGTCTVVVTNTGRRAGRETLLLYCCAPMGLLGKPSRVLIAFGKSDLLQPGQAQRMTLRFDREALASYDDTGKTGYRDCFVLEMGEYRFFVDSLPAGSYVLEETLCLRRCQRVCTVQNPFPRLTAVEAEGAVRAVTEPVPAGKVDLKRRITSRLPKEIFCTGDRGFKLSDVAKGNVSMDDFIGQLSLEELEGLTRGEGIMNSPLGTAGNAGAFGGILPSLREKGILPLMTSDGPAGLRLKVQCSLLPCGTALACTWDEPLAERLYSLVGREMIQRNVDVFLGPGLNIHRNVLCGRNFEYYSEDPLLSGKMAAAVVRGIQSSGRSACPKHFACNNQETQRNTNDSRVSVRALREIYLRGFEICVKEGTPNTIMTSYNKVNGVWSHYNYDLATTLLREEWGFTGVVITDWWMRRSRSPEFPRLRDNAYRVRAQVDVLMPGNMGFTGRGYKVDKSLLSTVGKPDGLTRAELQRTARTVLNLLMKTGKML